MKPEPAQLFSPYATPRLSATRSSSLGHSPLAFETGNASAPVVKATDLGWFLRAPPLSVCGCNHLTPRSSAATSAAAPAAWRSSPPSAAPRRASADLVAERCDAAICPESREKRKCAGCA